jgi:hypothetical protein
VRPSPWARENDFLLRVIHGADAPWLDSCDGHRNDGDWNGVLAKLSADESWRGDSFPAKQHSRTAFSGIISLPKFMPSPR